MKQAFQTRRKTLRNALKPFGMPAEATTDPIFDKRAEQLGVAEFVGLTQRVAQHQAGGAALPELDAADIADE